MRRAGVILLAMAGNPGDEAATGGTKGIIRQCFRRHPGGLEQAGSGGRQRIVARGRRL